MCICVGNCLRLERISVPCTQCFVARTHCYDRKLRFGTIFSCSNVSLAHMVPAQCTPPMQDIFQQRGMQFRCVGAVRNALPIKSCCA